MATSNPAVQLSIIVILQYEHLCAVRDSLFMWTRMLLQDLSNSLHHLLSGASLHWKTRADTGIRLIMNSVNLFYVSSLETEMSEPRLITLSQLVFTQREVRLVSEGSFSRVLVFTSADFCGKSKSLDERYHFLLI